MSKSIGTIESIVLLNQFITEATSLKLLCFNSPLYFSGTYLFWTVSNLTSNIHFFTVPVNEMEPLHKQFWIIQYWDICFLPYSLSWSSPTCLNTSNEDAWLQYICVSLCSKKILLNCMLAFSIFGLVASSISYLRGKQKKKYSLHFCLFKILLRSKMKVSINHLIMRLTQKIKIIIKQT